MPLALMALVGALAFNFPTVLPLMAKFTFHGDASTYALLTSAMGAGAVLGALVNGARGRVSPALVARVGLRLRRGARGGRGRARAGGRARAPAAGGRRERHVQRGGQHDAAALRRAAPARARDGDLRDGLRRHDADRRTARGLAVPERRPAARASGVGAAAAVLAGVIGAAGVRRSAPASQAAGLAA